MSLQVIEKARKGFSHITNYFKTNSLESSKDSIKSRSKKDTSSDFLFKGIIFALFVSLVSEFFFGPIIDKVSNQSYYIRVGRVLQSSLALLIIFLFSLSYGLIRPVRWKHVNCLTGVLTGGMIMVWFGILVSYSLGNSAHKIEVFINLSKSSLYYGIPFASGAMLLQLVLGINYSLIYSVSIAYLLTIYMPEIRWVFPYVLVTCFVGSSSLKRVRSRTSYLKSGFDVAIISISCVFISVLLSESIDTANFAVQLMSALVGSIGCFLVVSGCAPILEVLGGFVTDLRLIEMATLDHPVLKTLSVQAPGTWNHSMVIGMMSEAAAESIGANPVLSRVGSYFHDIGKTNKPAYFVENQFGSENRHNKLSPSMSALIIKSHVKEGLEIAKQAKLPEPLLDMITQHHGTSTIEYFYKKALKEAEEQDDNVEVDISLYQYSGPRPQTKEAGILMLADGIEAASRTISEPTLDRIQGLVQKMINKVFASGQLNECDITLQDLHLIAKSFTKVLFSIHHQRIAYSEPAEKGKASDSKAETSLVNDNDVKKTPSLSTSGNSQQSSSSKQHSENVHKLGDNNKSESPKNQNGDQKGDSNSNQENLKRLGIE